MKLITLSIPNFGLIRNPLRHELSAVVKELQKEYPSLHHTQYDDGDARGLLLGDSALRVAMGDAYPNFMGPYFADFRIEPPNTGTRDRYELTQQFAFGKVDKKMRLFGSDKTGTPTPSEVKQMTDEFGKLINGGYMSCLVPIGATTRHYDPQGDYSHSLVSVFSTWDSLTGVRDLIKRNVLEYMKRSRETSIPQR